MINTRLKTKQAVAKLLYNHVAENVDGKLDRRDRREVIREIIDLLDDQNVFKKQENFFLLTDFYKQTHWMQTPNGTSEIYSYYENRNSIFPKQVFFGLSYILQEYFEGVVARQWMIDEARQRVLEESGFDYFNLIGAQRIVDVHGGRLPLEIKAAPEGSIIPTGNVLFTLRNTDPLLPFLTNYVESIIMQVYSTIGTATLSFYIRKLGEKWGKVTGVEMHSFFLTDFGLRGGSSLETSKKNGGAHLLVFKGSDNEPAQSWLTEYYNAPTVLGSVFATEHSTTTIWGRDGEKDAVRKWITEAPESAVLSFVIDSYNYKEFITKILGDPEIKALIMGRSGKIVARPDSGIPNLVAKNCLDLLASTFGFSMNDNYKVLDPHVGLIYGDGINYDSINLILKTIVEGGYCVSNIIFGMGGALIQGINRDSNGVAIKCAHGIVNGVPIDVYKDPIGGGKKSKKGYQKLHPTMNSFMTFSSADMPSAQFTGYVDSLKTVFLNGDLLIKPNYVDIKKLFEFYADLEPAKFYGTELDHL